MCVLILKYLHNKGTILENLIFVDIESNCNVDNVEVNLSHLSMIPSVLWSHVQIHILLL